MHVHAHGQGMKVIFLPFTLIQLLKTFQIGSSKSLSVFLDSEDMYSFLYRGTEF